MVMIVCADQPTDPTGTPRPADRWTGRQAKCENNHVDVDPGDWCYWTIQAVDHHVVDVLPGGLILAVVDDVAGRRSTTELTRSPKRLMLTIDLLRFRYVDVDDSWYLPILPDRPT